MSERLPYEEQLQQQWNDLSLPDENRAWEDMKRRLDEEDDDTPLLPFWLRGCAGWILLVILLVILLGLTWWIFRPEKWFTTKQEQVSQTKSNEHKIKQDTINYPNDSSGKTKVNIVTTVKDSNDILINKTPTVIVQIANGEKRKKKPVTSKEEDKNTGYAKIKNRRKKKAEKIIPVVAKKIGPDKIVNGNNTNKEKEDSSNKLIKKKSVLADSVTGVKPFKIDPVKDSTAVAKKDSLVKKQDETIPPVVKKDSTKKKTFSFSSGIALHQQIPVAVQGLTPYNELGRKGSLRDYIPSVYLRLNKDNRWFIQTGFRYGAPQLENGQLYSAKTDTISQQKYNTTSSYLKKTFYHQVPLTFHYHLSPALSIGTGAVWNKFSGAVSSQDVVQFDRQTGSDTALSTNVIFNSRSADSNFAKSYFQLSFETQYKWKRFSFGANYSVGLQPYIKFILPGGLQQQAKNKALQMFIRYELWRSKKKK